MLTWRFHHFFLNHAAIFFRSQKANHRPKCSARPIRKPAPLALWMLLGTPQRTGRPQVGMPMMAMNTMPIGP